tara:strand:+ start:1124 stop:1624 length:501 start_codon:yes stop_codon:yes gene_type:complete
MECDVCHKDNATVFLTQVVEGQVQKVNLCDECAETKGVTDPQGFNLAELLKGMGEKSTQSKSSRGTICPVCGFSQGDFKKTGRMGCSHCYVIFEAGVEGLLNAMHKGTSHLGKVPGQAPEEVKIDNQIGVLQKKLADSIENENYEEAALIRDQLRQLESENIASEA